MSLQLHRFLRNFQLHNISKDGVSLDENGVPVADFDIMHWTVFANKSTAGVKVGSVERDVLSELKVFINQDAIQWPTSFNEVADVSSFFLLCLTPHNALFSVQK